MKNYTLGYREVIPDQTVSDPWREISLNTGGTQGTLQDIKVPERANGFCYQDHTKHHTRNRIIYWRISHDVLELVENSLDINLVGNRIRYKFVDTPILDGISIHETAENVIILVPTVCSVHQLVFPHPDKYYRQDEGHPDLAAPSIFSEASAAEARKAESFHFFTNPSSQPPYLAASTLSLVEKEGIFVFAYPSGEILLVKHHENGKNESFELKHESIMPRFLSGLADKLRAKDKDGDTTVSLVLHNFGVQSYALTLTRDGNLKVWSCSGGECLAAIDVIGEFGGNTRNLVQGTQNHVIRTSIDGYDSECFLGISMCFSGLSQMYIFKPSFNGENFKLVRLATLSLPQNDLIDFSLSTTHIWSVWRDKDGETAVFSAPIRSGCVWHRVVLEPIPDASQPSHCDTENNDPRQVYLQQIFQHGRFPLQIITKALNIYKKSTIISNLGLSVNHLKQQICLAVEEEIQNELKESVVSDEDYLECANYFWQKFYSCCVQYHIAGLKPLGFLLLPNSSGAVLLKKTTISFLRPSDIFEHFLYCDEFDLSKEEISRNFLGNYMVTDDVIQLFKVITYIDQQMSEIFATTFEKELSLLKSPQVVMAALLEKILVEMDSEFTEHVADLISGCDDLYQAIHKILELLRFEYPVSDDVTASSSIFTSQMGVSMVTCCLRQQIDVRFVICRNLLLICNILLIRQDLDQNVLEAIRSVCTPEIGVLTQAHFVMSWLATLPVLSYLPTDTALQRLSSLKLSPVFNLKPNAMSSLSIFELFTGSTGGYEARKIFNRLQLDEDTLAHWNFSLLPYLNCLMNVICPIDGNPILAEWLLSCGQHVWLQQYVRYLSNWCEWNSCTHHFLLAASLLSTGECHKAEQLFELAAKGIFTDPFLAQRFLIYENDTKDYINYCLRIIHLFELHKAYDCAINLTNNALCMATKDEPLVATLYSIKFKHHLALKNYEMAYDALNSNPDGDRKKDSLRDFVKKLLDEKKLDCLLSFTYGGMEELFCDIVITRARASDVVDNFYYDFLYAFHIRKGLSFFRLAASVMYEQAFRLNHSNDVALEKQLNCLLAAKNALSLLDPQFQYIVMPVDQIEEKEITLPISAGSDEKPQSLFIKNHLNIVDLERITKEIAFTSAKVKLMKFKPESYFEITNPHELVMLLTNAGLFKLALKISKLFDVCYRISFESLTKKCGKITKNTDPSEWKWLSENDLQDLPFNTKGPATAAWNLIQQLLLQYEEPKLSTIHKIISNQIIKMNMFLPQWLLSSYKQRNPSELFRLFYHSGRLEEATEVAVEYMMAALGHGKEYYGLNHQLTATQPSLCLPIHWFVALRRQLSVINERDPEKPYLREFEQLSDVLELYLTTAQRVSNEKAQIFMLQ